jgi:hypothetical protein
MSNNHDATHAPTAPGQARRTMLDALAIAETVTLVLLFANMWTLDSGAFSMAVGYLHGGLFIAVVVLALVTPQVPVTWALIAAIPGLGAPILTWLLRRHEPAKVGELLPEGGVHSSP